MFKELNTELVGDYSDIDITNDTDICYICGYNDCNETGTKPFHTLVENKLAYCNEHHYLLHNSKINENLRKQNLLYYLILQFIFCKIFQFIFCLIINYNVKYFTKYIC